jgi:hypothetical protein
MPTLGGKKAILSHMMTNQILTFILSLVQKYIKLSISNNQASDDPHWLILPLCKAQKYIHFGHHHTK